MLIVLNQQCFYTRLMLTKQSEYPNQARPPKIPNAPKQNEIHLTISKNHEVQTTSQQPPLKRKTLISIMDCCCF